MKFYGIFRGFAGLGRVVSGIGILNKFKSEGHDVRVFTYKQGLSIASEYGYKCFSVKDDSDIGFMGIVPISPTGLAVVDDIVNWKPDCILIDGEPLMTEFLHLAGINGKIIALTNPMDLYSEKNHPITMKYFRYLFCQSDMILCHGLHGIDSHLPDDLKKKVYCMNTILREEILSLKSVQPKYINCILGGGTKNCSSDFVNSTLEIAGRIAFTAKNKKNFTFNIYCNDSDIGEKISRLFSLPNLNIFTKYVSPAEIYGKSKLVICRAGRNTISELLYLKIPAIVIPILSNVVSIEQNNNVRHAAALSEGNIAGYGLNDNEAELIDIFDSLLERKLNHYNWIPGNQKAYNLIKSAVMLNK